MTYVCPRTRGTAKVVCVLLFILAAVTGVFSSLGIGWKGLWQLQSSAWCTCRRDTF